MRTREEIAAHAATRNVRDLRMFTFMLRDKLNFRHLSDNETMQLDVCVAELLSRGGNDGFIAEIQLGREVLEAKWNLYLLYLPNE